MTVRAVAQAAGFLTKVVSHYFENKRALLLATYRFAAERSSAVAEATQQEDHACIKRFVDALLPVNSEQRENWVVWYAFWAYALTDSEFAAEQRAQVDRTRERMNAIIRQDSKLGTLGHRATKTMARSLLTEVIGIALQAVFDETLWSPRRQKAAVAARIHGFIGNGAKLS